MRVKAIHVVQTAARWLRSFLDVRLPMGLEARTAHMLREEFHDDAR